MYEFIEPRFTKSFDSKEYIQRSADPIWWQETGKEDTQCRPNIWEIYVKFVRRVTGDILQNNINQMSNSTKKS